jgi:serine/threonine protein kinase
VFETGHLIDGKYRLLRLLGEGGMGAVYEAQHELLGTRVAVKVIHSELARRPGLADRFLQEGRVAAQIQSAHVVHVADIDRTPEGVAYMVMELLEGEPLASVLERDRRLPVAVACEYTKQILEGIEAAHAIGVTHRDLKPENVFVTHAVGRPVLKLIDFGIAKLRRTDVSAKGLTAAGVTMGTAEYMAPEQAYSADQADARSDLFAVGVMFYEMVSGARPARGDDAREVAMKVARGDVTPLVHAAPDVPRELAGFAHRAMAARPEMRFQSATEMRLALQAMMNSARKVSAPVAVDAAAPHTLLRAPEIATAAPRAPFVPFVPDDEAPVRTERAPPVGASAPGYTPPRGYGGVSPYGDPSPRTGHSRSNAPPQSRRRRGNAWLFALLPLVVGAAAVVVFVVVDPFGDAPHASPSSPTSLYPSAPAVTLTTPVPPSPSTVVSPTSPRVPAPIAPLLTTAAHSSPTPTPTPTPTTTTPKPRPPVGTAIPGDAGESQSVPPFVSGMPSSFPIPGIPGVISFGDGGTFAPPFGIPSSFPSAFPIPFPTSIPAPTTGPLN